MPPSSAQPQVTDDQNPTYHPGNFGDWIESIGNLGVILGEEVVEVAEDIDASDDRGGLRATQRIVTVPGKERGSYDPDGEYDFKLADPVDIRLSLLTVDHLAFACVSGEVLTGIGQRLQQESPLQHPVTLTHCTGSSGYIPDDAAYKKPSYEVVSGSQIMQGAENAVVEGLVQLIDPQ